MNLFSILLRMCGVWMAIRYHPYIIHLLGIHHHHHHQQHQSQQLGERVYFFLSVTGRRHHVHEHHNHLNHHYCSMSSGLVRSSIIGDLALEAHASLCFAYCKYICLCYFWTNNEVGMIRLKISGIAQNLELMELITLYCWKYSKHNY